MKDSALLKYFAYGSNMSVPRLQQRVPSARYIGAYYLPKHDLRFHKKGVDGSAKCDAFLTNKEEDVVFGVLFEFCPSEKHFLDAAEGLGVFYFEKDVTIYDQHHQAEQASLYYASDSTPDIQPFTWYKHHVFYGASQANLPADYLAKIEQIAAIDDTDDKRKAKEMAIY
ncbi:gamma-glutamylcyclotransferase family protein [Thalassotalea euphylliae]|uniref:Gamma-glutamylcyclotransferase n=1 Tax=Thalassotalea euphylliae TaxID=1655234 RepID=A0A3E0UE67_9GAMM|nr:gamma-glutamylcyclotransferase family protein [Thalassotalea euphylliae]REL34994.1 gamma-glutamylcyclotransferase [Thalassotalea euphylliae]